MKKKLADTTGIVRIPFNAKKLALFDSDPESMLDDFGAFTGVEDEAHKDDHADDEGEEKETFDKSKPVQELTDDEGIEKVLFAKNLHFAERRGADTDAALEGIREIRREEGEAHRSKRDRESRERRADFDRNADAPTETDVPEEKKLAASLNAEDELDNALSSLKKLRNSERVVSHSDTQGEEKKLYRESISAEEKELIDMYEKSVGEVMDNDNRRARRQL